jgi:Tfp pilus assembly protein PilN
VTAALEQPQSNEALNRLLLQLGALALLVLAIAAAIFRSVTAQSRLRNVPSRDLTPLGG